MNLAKALAFGAGGIALGTGGWAVGLFLQLKTGLPNLDALRSPLIAAMMRHACISPRFGRAMMAIFHNEHSRATGLTADADLKFDIHDPMELGDVDLPVGPSIGPGQVYRKTAVDLVARGLLSGPWVAASASREAYTAFGSDPANLWELVNGAVITFKDKLDRATDQLDTSGKGGAGGDYDLAIEFYNGGSPTKRAEAAGHYAEIASAFEAQLFSDGSAA